MKTVHKYPLEIADHQTLLLSGNFEILHAGLDPNGKPCLWALVDPNNVKLDVPILMCGTGWPLPETVGPHIASFVSGDFVWHLFHAKP